MDAKTAEKVGKLAKQLKQFHMASSMDEATAKASEMVRNPPCDDFPVKELMKKELDELRAQVKEDNRIISEIKKELDDLKANTSKDLDIHSIEKNRLSKAQAKSDRLKESVDDMATITDVVEHLQEN